MEVQWRAVSNTASSYLFTKAGLPSDNLATKIPPPRFFKRISALLTRPYWKRVWAIRELSKGREVDVLCGHRSIKWDHFSEGDQAARLYKPQGSFGAQLLQRSHQRRRCSLHWRNSHLHMVRQLPASMLALLDVAGSPLKTGVNVMIFGFR